MVNLCVITVCLNAEAVLERTIKSILNQTCVNYEYIIKDGGSTDQTVNLANSYLSAFSEKNIPFRVISKPDRGIYDAMNEAVREASGDWVIFMNAGDCLANNSVLEVVEKSDCLHTSDIVYGDVIKENVGLYRYYKADPLEKIRFGLPFSHQSVFTKRELLVERPYSNQYLSCDHEFYLDMYRQGRRFGYIPEPISIFAMDGISSNWENFYQQKIAMLENMSIRDEEAIQVAKNVLENTRKKDRLKKILRKILPARIQLSFRRLQCRRRGWKTEEEMFGSKKEAI